MTTPNLADLYPNCDFDLIINYQDGTSKVFDNLKSRTPDTEFCYFRLFTEKQNNYGFLYTINRDGFKREEISFSTGQSVMNIMSQVHKLSQQGWEIVDFNESYFSMKRKG